MYNIWVPTIYKSFLIPTSWFSIPPFGIVLNISGTCVEEKILKSY